MKTRKNCDSQIPPPNITKRPESSETDSLTGGDVTIGSLDGSRKQQVFFRHRPLHRVSQFHTNDSPQYAETRGLQAIASQRIFNRSISLFNLHNGTPQTSNGH
ncbi:MAG: hypothetical protein Rhob2KO_10510 [Rhodopirellula baltica]